ncbi:synaptopodin-2 isoform X3 [Gambusia affinis]|uniref:synaptopodin-2 isoform X3 n=1 Tax=Gambusia affinis TaxID=33528 RepID=UPI001CDC92B2|nr:synaptopodin-2 isoform X3 [Gambusia affinis]
MTESSYIKASQTSATSDSKSWQHSCSSSSSLGCAADTAKVLTQSSERPLGASDGHGPSTENRSVDSSEEGGSSVAPPASVFFGISDEGAEQAETRNLGSDRDLCRPDRQRARYTRLSHKESQSERHVRETKSKCKRIAQLLANAPNPQNKGALLFKKRRQRVKKYTLVSYGTGVHAFDSSGHTEGETDKVRSAGYSFPGSSDSDFEEQYFQHHQYHNPALNWESGEDMDVLPETKGKGLLMFEQRRKRIDELVSEQEEERNEGFSEDVLKETQRARIYESKEMYMHAEETNVKKHLDYHADVQEVNHLSTVPKPMVPNRTAKPFLGFQDSPTLEPVTMSGGVIPAMKKHELAFKVPVPINSNPKVWSPTGDIIASRDERISVPAIKTGILPESKRKTANKHPSEPAKESELYGQSKGERKSYIESEEDFFSLGAEACNFMQPKPIKLKNPPPVAPKPTINPACPPWNPSSEPYVPSRSPVSHPSHSPIGLHGQHYLQQQDWTRPQQMAGHWASDQTEASLQTPANARVPVNSSQLRLQPTTNSWSQQPSLSRVFGRSRSLSLPQRLNSLPSPGLLSPLSMPGVQPAFSPTQRQTSFHRKPLSPWEAASRSPIGSVDEAFMFRSPMSSIASDVMAAAHHRSLPEPPEEWKRRVSLDSAAVRKGHCEHLAPSFQAVSSSRKEKPAVYGPPFRPAQPLRPVSLGFKAQSPNKLPHFFLAQHREVNTTEK